MRMRRKRNLPQRMEKCEKYLVSEPILNKGRWKAAFGRELPLHLEIGCGKGGFITEMAQKHPDILFVAVEKFQSVLILAMERAMAMGLTNVLFIDIDAAKLDEVFAENEIERVYLNFSDPWPQKKRAKRRLTCRGMLSVYDRFLIPGGEIHQKTDNQHLFEFSLCEFSQIGYTLEEVSLDLHATDTENVMTEYEQSFSQQGMKIYRAVARKKDQIHAQP